MTGEKVRRENEVRECDERNGSDRIRRNDYWKMWKETMRRGKVMTENEEREIEEKSRNIYSGESKLWERMRREKWHWEIRRKKVVGMRGEKVSK